MTAPGPSPSPPPPQGPAGAPAQAPTSVPDATAPVGAATDSAGAPRAPAAAESLPHIGPGPIPAIYFDGRSAAARAVWVQLHQGTLTIADRHRVPFLSVPRDRVKVQEALRNAPQRIELEGGATLMVEDKKRLAHHLDRSGMGPGIIERAQRSWFTVCCALVALAGLLWILQLWLLPWSASLAARWLPGSIEDRLVDQYWPETDRRMFQPSALPESRQSEIRQQFAQLVARQPAPPEYHLEFRRWSGGANAFAFPGGLIVVSDELVRRVGNREALLGVLAHELGHVAGRHALRTVVQKAAISSVYGLFFGDAGVLAEAMPGALASMRYSRGFELNADDYAIETLRRGELPIGPYADLVETLAPRHAPAAGKPGPDLSRLLASHPAPAQRVARLRRAAGADAPPADPAVPGKTPQQTPGKAPAKSPDKASGKAPA